VACQVLRISFAYGDEIKGILFSSPFLGATLNVARYHVSRTPRRYCRRHQRYRRCFFDDRRRCSRVKAHMKYRGRQVLILLYSFFFSLCIVYSELIAPKASGTTAQTVDPAVVQEKFGVVRHCSGPRYINISSFAYMNSDEYAKMHGYEHFVANATTMPSQTFFTPKSWLKVGFMWQILTHRRDIQWLLWLDCDALITQLGESIQDLLKSLSVNSTQELIVAQDLAPSPFNLGVMFVRNTCWTRDVLGRLMVLAEDHDTRNHPWWEQHALHALFAQNYKRLREKIYVVQNRARINAFASLEEEKPDTFIWHRVNCHDQPTCDQSFREKYCTIHPQSHYCS